MGVWGEIVGGLAAYVAAAFGLGALIGLTRRRRPPDPPPGGTIIEGEWREIISL